MTYAVCIIWTIAVALWSACDDAEQIALNERIHHVRQWVIRAALVGLVCLCAGLPLFAIPMGALFSSVFRFTLNRLRGLDWRYISDSNDYDWLFIVNFSDYKPNPGHYRAGLLAYIAEALVVLIFALFV